MFYAERLSGEPSPPRRNTLNIINSTELSGNNTQKMITLSSVASPERQIVKNDSNSNEPTMPNWFGWQLLNNPPNLNNLNLPPNPFKIRATMTVVQPKAEWHDGIYSLQSREPFGTVTDINLLTSTQLRDRKNHTRRRMRVFSTLMMIRGEFF